MRWEIVWVSVAILLLLMVLMTIIFLVSFFKKPKVKIDDEFIDSLLESLGTINNVQRVETENGRLIISVNDLDLVNLDGIKEKASSGVFVTGNKIKTLFRLDSKIIKDYIEKRK